MLAVIHSLARATGRIVAGLVFVLTAVLSSQAQEWAIHQFVRQQLTGTYYSEGANGGDLNGDGHVDLVYGPYWYAGPDWKVAHELYPAKPQPMEHYADNFFNWVYDFNGDGRSDVFVVGFPGTPAYVYENPGPEQAAQPWPKHHVFDSVSNESPHFVQVVGDPTPELVCTFEGMYGVATWDPKQPWEKWVFHPISDKSAPERFGHGLGVGDLNGDGRADVLCAAGWYEQPADRATSTRWKFHPVAFTDSYGGAEMHAYDVDGDGDQDVITSLAAHDFGLAWYEQLPAESSGEPKFQQRLIMGERPDQNAYGQVISELHSVALADMDGDGLKDIVTGKTYYSHHQQSPQWDAGAVVVWFKLQRNPDGVNWIPYLADTEAGIGRQVSVLDVNQDQLPDIVVGGMKGAHVLLHQKKNVDQPTWNAAQPQPRSASGN